MQFLAQFQFVIHLSLKIICCLRGVSVPLVTVKKAILAVMFQMQNYVHNVLYTVLYKIYNLESCLPSVLTLTCLLFLRTCTFNINNYSLSLLQQYCVRNNKYSAGRVALCAYIQEYCMYSLIIIRDYSSFFIYFAEMKFNLTFTTWIKIIMFLD